MVPKWFTCMRIFITQCLIRGKIVVLIKMNLCSHQSWLEKIRTNQFSCTAHPTIYVITIVLVIDMSLWRSLWISQFHRIMILSTLKNSKDKVTLCHFEECYERHNILLDYDFNQKISNFGLAKLCLRDQSTFTCKKRLI